MAVPFSGTGEDSGGAAFSASFPTERVDFGGYARRTTTTFAIGTLFTAEQIQQKAGHGQQKILEPRGLWWGKLLSSWRWLWRGWGRGVPFGQGSRGAGALVGSKRTPSSGGMHRFVSRSAVQFLAGGRPPHFFFGGPL